MRQFNDQVTCLVYVDILDIYSSCEGTYRRFRKSFVKVYSSALEWVSLTRFLEGLVSRIREVVFLVNRSRDSG